jgi:hypothetical protein
VNLKIDHANKITLPQHSYTLPNTELEKSHKSQDKPARTQTEKHVLADE